jgi:hypothetical protein
MASLYRSYVRWRSTNLLDQADRRPGPIGFEIEQIAKYKYPIPAFCRGSLNPAQVTNGSNQSPRATMLAARA